jgi:hypothetical protein
MLAPGTWVYVKGVNDPLQIRQQAPSMPTVVNGVRAAYPAFMLSDGSTRPLTDLTLAPVCPVCQKPIRLTETVRYVFEMTPQQFAGKIFPSATEVIHKQCLGQTPAPVQRDSAGQGVSIQAPASFPATPPTGSVPWPPPGVSMPPSQGAPKVAAPPPPQKPPAPLPPAAPSDPDAASTPKGEGAPEDAPGGIVYE